MQGKSCRTLDTSLHAPNITANSQGARQNGWQAECQLGLANLFLEMSCDMCLRELIGESAVQQPSDGLRAHDPSAEITS